MNEGNMNVLGPYSTNNWHSLKALKDQTEWMNVEDPIRFKEAIRKNKYLFRKIVDKTIDMDEA